MNEPAWIADAERYDRWFDEPWGSYASGVEHAALLDAIGDPSGSTMLDVGCGTGRFTETLHVRSAAVIGIELDVAMLAVAARRLDVPLIRADALGLPVRDAAVDVAVAVTVCEFIAEPAMLIAELARVTKPGGRIVIGALNRHSPWGLANRRQFDEPPWNSARFLTVAELRDAGARYGEVDVTHALFAPGALPGLSWWGSLLESIGRVIARRCGAFTVVAIDKAL